MKTDLECTTFFMWPAQKLNGMMRYYSNRRGWSDWSPIITEVKP